MNERKTQPARWIFWILLLNVAASLFHYLHNMIYFDVYPNEPDWLSPGRIDMAWLVITPLGVLGYLLYRRRRPVPGLALLLIYGVAGLGVLGHYLLAPLSAHTFMMNLSIWFESLAAAVLLAAVCRLFLADFSLRRSVQ